jgi:hypothetical protein
LFTLALISAVIPDVHQSFEMEQILEKIDSLQAELASLKSLTAEYQKALDKKIRLEFNYNS